MEFVNEFKETYSYFQYNTPHIAQGVLHLILGQLPAVKSMRINVDANYIDTRVHIVWFQQAATGKGRGYNLAGMICDGIGLKYQPIHEITDAALIGGFEKQERYDSERKARVSDYEFVPGALQKGHTSILAMNEASMLFNLKPTQIQKHAMDYYQVAMNTMGTKDNLITKRVLHGGQIECQPDCSLFLSSYIPDKFNEVVATRGFASRTLNIINDVSSDKRYQSMLHSAKYFNVQREKAKANLGDAIAKFNFINDFYKDVTTFQSHKDVNRPLRHFVSEIYETTSEIGKFHRKKLEEFMQRFQEIGYKIMYHSCVLRLGSQIEAEDVVYARNFLMPIWKNFITYLEESMVQDRKEKYRELQLEQDVVNAYDKLLATKRFNDKDGFIPRPLVKKMLQLKIWRCSPATADKRIKWAEEIGLIDRRKKGKTPIIKVVRRAANYS